MILPVVALVLGGAGQGADEAKIERRIEFHSAQVARDPSLWPAHAELGKALFDRANRTRDPEDVRRATAAAQASLEIQPNYPAMKLLAAVSNFRHRFDEATLWASRAREAMPEDSSLVTMLVEAALGRGDLEAARSILPAPGPGGDVYLEVARAKVLAASGEREASARLFAGAADLAEAAGSPDLAAWALVQAAALFLDSARPDPARPYLERARELAPDDAGVLVHRAELAQLEGDPRAALRLYERALDRTGDPAIAAAAYPAALASGERERADRLFAQAEAGLRRAVEAGETYTVGALEKLLAAHDKHLGS